MATSKLDPKVKKLLDGLPSSGDELSQGGRFRYGGYITGIDPEPDATYGYQIKFTTETKDTEKGIMYEWFGFGKNFTKTGRVAASSKGGIFIERVEHLIGKFKWSDLFGKYVVWEREMHDFGSNGVSELALPIYIGDEEIDRDVPESIWEPDKAPSRAQADSDDAEDEQPEPEDEESSDEAEYEVEHVRLALALMDGKGDRDFRKAVAKEDDLDDTTVQDHVAEGTFQEYAVNQGYAEFDGKTYNVISVPDDE